MQMYSELLPEGELMYRKKKFKKKKCFHHNRIIQWNNLISYKNNIIALNLKNKTYFSAVRIGLWHYFHEHHK